MPRALRVDGIDVCLWCELRGTPCVFGGGRQHLILSEFTLHDPWPQGDG